MPSLTEALIDLVELIGHHCVISIDNGVCFALGIDQSDHGIFKDGGSL